jgi:hypothetical protein
MDGITDEQLHTLFRWVKDGPTGAIPIEAHDRSFGVLIGVTHEDAGNHQRLLDLGRWHESAFAWFPDPYPVTPFSARRWLVEQILDVPDRLLFWVKDLRGRYAGHVGLSQVDFQAQEISISDVVVANPGHEPLVSQAIETLERWARENLQLQPRASTRTRLRAA